MSKHGFKTASTALVSLCLLCSACQSKSDQKSNEKNEVEKTTTVQNIKETKTMELVTLPSGLMYQILQEGDNKVSAQKGNKVTVHYTGWLDQNGAKGTKFDSSVDRGTPFKFNLGAGQVIAGWEQGVEGMKIGEKRLLVIPSSLGYGSRGAGSVIPGNATLRFEVELLNAE